MAEKSLGSDARSRLWSWRRRGPREQAAAAPARPRYFAPFSERPLCALRASAPVTRVCDRDAPPERAPGASRDSASGHLRWRLPPFFIVALWRRTSFPSTLTFRGGRSERGLSPFDRRGVVLCCDRCGRSPYVTRSPPSDVALPSSAPERKGRRLARRRRSRDVFPSWVNMAPRFDVTLFNFPSTRTPMASSHVASLRGFPGGFCGLAPRDFAPFRPAGTSRCLLLFTPWRFLFIFFRKDNFFCTSAIHTF